MAHTKFTFTFPTGVAGGRVTFNADTFDDPQVNRSTRGELDLREPRTRDGVTFTDPWIIVYSDAASLTATTTDAAGNPLTATATTGSPVAAGPAAGGGTTPGSQPSAASVVAPDWQPSTAYKAKQLVWQAGQLYRAKAAFTSGASFSASNWDAVGSGAYAPAKGQGVARFIGKCLAGGPVTVSFVGDSISYGNNSSAIGAASVTYTGAAITSKDFASILSNTLAAQYGITVNKRNRAVSGRTVQSGLVNDFPTALADAADLYVISYAHNDFKSDNATPGIGYPKAASWAGVVHMIRKIRATVPNADILLWSEPPYGFVFPNLPIYSAGLEQRARQFGCEWVDIYATFNAQPSLTPLIDVDNAHPSDLGHALIASTMAASFPATYTGPSLVPATPPDNAVDTQYRYDRLGWQAFSTRVRANGNDGWATTGTWTSPTSPVWTSSTVGDYTEAMFIGTECAVHLDTGTGAAVVNVDVNGARLYTNLDLTATATYPTQQNTIIPILASAAGAPWPMGVNVVRITIVSGTLTVRAGFDFLHAPCEWIDCTDPRVTFTGSWATGSGISTSYGGNRKSAPAVGDTFAFDFIGTGFSINTRYATSSTMFTPTIDGVAQASVTRPAGLSTAMGGNFPIASGLEYGRHTVSVAYGPTAGSLPEVYGICVFDETRLVRPRRQRGVALVGTAVKFPVPFAGRPVVVCNNITSDTGIVRPTSGTATGFTPSGTAAEQAIYDADGGLVAY